MIVFVGAVAAGATGAFFSDTETSTGNTFAAGAIDLGIDNTSYYNGVLSDGTSWELDFDIDECINDQGGPCLFFDFDDLKPGDYGEDTISLHVNDNDSWLCADVTLTEDADNTCVEPEEDSEGAGICGSGNALTNGDLADQIRFLWWADDGDNVLEDNERQLPAGPLGFLNVGQTAHVELVDSDDNIFGAPGDPLTGAQTHFIGKAWCFGNIAALPLADDDSQGRSPAGNNDGNGPPGQPTDGGYTCTGAAGVSNSAQTDRVRLDVSFNAVQSRNNSSFQCLEGITGPGPI